MSELMSSQTYTFQGLSAKYKGFHQPCWQIKAGSADMAADLDLYIDSLEIQQTIKNKSGQCKFTIQNAYDLKTRKFKDSIKSGFPLGQTIDARLGYGNASTLFKGFVSDVSFSFASGGAPKATIVCHDIRALMLQGKMNASPPVSSFPLIMTYLMAYYSSLLNMRIIYFDVWNILEDFRQNTNDFNYIYSYGEKRGYEFFVLGDYIYFRKKWLNPTPIMTLEWGEGIISFDRSFTYSASQLKGTLNNILSLMPFSADELVKPGYPFKMVPQQSIKFHMDTSDAKNTLDLINIMATYAVKLTDDMVGGSVICIGLPEIVPGRYIRLKNLDAGFLDKDYYIEEVTHSLSGSGYTTSFNISSGK